MFDFYLTEGQSTTFQLSFFSTVRSSLTVNAQVLSSLLKFEYPIGEATTLLDYQISWTINSGWTRVRIGDWVPNPAQPSQVVPIDSLNFAITVTLKALADTTDSAAEWGGASIRFHDSALPADWDSVTRFNFEIAERGPAVPGFDTSAYPGDAAMSWLKTHTNLQWVAYYLAPAPNRTNASWMGQRQDLAQQGWDVAPVYVGEQPDDNPQGLSSKCSAAKGTTDGHQAVAALTSQGFSKGTIVYLDVEPGTLDADDVAYVKAWYAAVTASDFVAGVYCRLNHASILDKEVLSPLWIVREFKPWNPSPPIMEKSPTGTTTFPAPLPSTSGYADAFGRQYVLDDFAKYTIYTPTKSFTADLDSISIQLVKPGTPAADTMRLGNQTDFIFGLSGNDTLDGGGGNDRIEGGNGNDLLIGGIGSDFMSGGAGGDTLSGGAGRDRLAGGLGADRFDFDAVSQTGKTATTRDIIVDFTHNAQVALSDIIDLNGMDADSTTTNNQNFIWLGATAFSGAKGALRYRIENPVGTANDKTLIEGDTNGDKIADFQIELANIRALVITDFVL